MKKMILSLCVFGLLSGTAYAACNGGTMRDGFCVSNVRMNWWSAQAWCQANGLHLATMYEACPDWDGNTGYDKCGHVIEESGDYVWTSTASETGNAYYIHSSSGNVKANPRNAGGVSFALCK